MSTRLDKVVGKIKSLLTAFLPPKGVRPQPQPPIKMAPNLPKASLTTVLHGCLCLYKPLELPPDDATHATRGDSRPLPDRGYGLIGRHSIMDPFEVRIRFTQHLQHLNASVTSANKAAQYALKYKDMDEDLHSCILEQLERVCIVAT